MMQATHKVLTASSILLLLVAAPGYSANIWAQERLKISQRTAATQANAQTTRKRERKRQSRPEPVSPATGSPPDSGEKTNSESLNQRLENSEKEIHQLKNEIQSLLAQVPMLSGLGTASRLWHSWDIWMLVWGCGILMGLVAGVFLPQRFRRRLRQTNTNDHSSTTGKSHVRITQLESRLNDMEKSVQKLQGSLPFQKEMAEKAKDLAGDAEENQAPMQVLSGTDPYASSQDQEKISLASISTLPPSQYLKAIHSATNVQQTCSANPDFRFPGKLVNVDKGRFLIISVADDLSERSLALPAFDRLGGADEFSYYKELFDCDRPVGGDIYVIQPATVSEDKLQGSWKLEVRGKLEIRR
jgi:hypothetical protein